ncbi:MAG: DUF2835 domain-containing protein [Pseudomonadaceae bacterium]|nr:DUF2835 domain-containing protein [Pseudomonadaceae bacterium]
MQRIPITPAASKRRYVVNLRLTPAQIQAFYAGDVSQVSARDRQGVRIAFPIVSLRRFIGHDGISGTFAIEVDGHNRLQKIERL